MTGLATRSTPLKWDVFAAKRQGITRDLPPGKEHPELWSEHVAEFMRSLGDDAL
jgi:hypothetical protein